MHNLIRKFVNLKARMFVGLGQMLKLKCH